MADPKQTELVAAKTQELPAVRPAVAPRDIVPTAQDDRQFRAEQERIQKMIAADAPLSEILSNLVLMIEAQSPEMLCSILLLSADGNHVRHAVAPSLPEDYVMVIDGSPIGPKHGSSGTAMYRGKTGNRQRHFYRPALGRISQLCMGDRCGCLLVHPDNVEQGHSAWFVCHVLPRAAYAKRRRDAPHTRRHQAYRPCD